jgi:4-hydroxyphenylpyruvate dioxygenase
LHFLVNEDPDSFAAAFAAEHGPSACGSPSAPARWPRARTRALRNGAEEIGPGETSKAVAAPVIKGIGGCMLYLVDRYDEAGTIFDRITSSSPAHSAGRASA